MSAAPSSSMSAFIAPHRLRRERIAESLNVAQIFFGSAPRPVGSVAPGDGPPVRASPTTDRSTDLALSPPRPVAFIIFAGRFRSHRAKERLDVSIFSEHHRTVAQVSTFDIQFSTFDFELRL